MSFQRALSKLVTVYMALLVVLSSVLLYKQPWKEGVLKFLVNFGEEIFPDPILLRFIDKLSFQKKMTVVHSFQ